MTTLQYHPIISRLSTLCSLKLQSKLAANIMLYSPKPHNTLILSQFDQPKGKATLYGNILFEFHIHKSSVSQLSPNVISKVSN